jgi:hypothetical protein
MGWQDKIAVNSSEGPGKIYPLIYFLSYSYNNDRFDLLQTAMGFRFELTWTHSTC